VAVAFSVVPALEVVKIALRARLVPADG
jgi:hypothetical protein